MDTLHSVLFYALATLTVSAGLAAALAPVRLRPPALGLLAVGLAGLYATLSAGFAALVALVAYLGVAALVASHLGWEKGLGLVVAETRGRLEQAAGPLAAVAFAVLAYLAWRSAFHLGYWSHGEFNGTALGRLLVNRDALGLEALALLLLVSAAGAALSGRVRR